MIKNLILLFIISILINITHGQVVSSYAFCTTDVCIRYEEFEPNMNNGAWIDIALMHGFNDTISIFIDDTLVIKQLVVTDEFSETGVAIRAFLSPVNETYLSVIGAGYCLHQPLNRNYKVLYVNIDKLTEDSDTVDNGFIWRLNYFN